MTVLQFTPVGVASRLLAGSTAESVITVNTDSPVNFHDFEISANSQTGATISIVVTSAHTLNTGSQFRNIELVGFDTGISTIAAANWVMDRLNFLNNITNSLIVQDTYNPDAGDSTITNSNFSSSETNAHIDMVSSGGLRIVNNKLNGASLYGISLNLVAGAHTADLFIIGNSWENITGSCIRLARQDNTATFGNVVITGNKLESSGVSGNCVGTAVDAGTWLTHVVVSSNVCLGGASGSNTTFNFATPVPGLIITNTSVQGGGSTNCAIITSTEGTDCISRLNGKIRCL